MACLTLVAVIKECKLCSNNNNKLILLLFCLIQQVLLIKVLINILMTLNLFVRIESCRVQ